MGTPGGCHFTSRGVSLARVDRHKRGLDPMHGQGCNCGVNAAYLQLGRGRQVANVPHNGMGSAKPGSKRGGGRIAKAGTGA